MDPLALIESLPGTSPLAFAAAAVAGLTVALSSAPMLPAVAGYVAARAGPSARPAPFPFRLALPFVLGIAVVDAALGGLTGLLGDSLFDALGAHPVATHLAVAVVLLLLGMGMASGIGQQAEGSCARPTGRGAVLRAFALGVPFGLAACPTCIPLLLPLLGVAALSGHAGYGALLLFAFGLGRILPLMLVGTAIGRLAASLVPSELVPHVPRVAGLLLAATGGYYAWLALRAAGYA